MIEFAIIIFWIVNVSAAIYLIYALWQYGRDFSDEEKIFLKKEISILQHEIKDLKDKLQKYEKH